MYFQQNKQFQDLGHHLRGGFRELNVPMFVYRNPQFTNKRVESSSWGAVGAESHLGSIWFAAH